MYVSMPRRISQAQKLFHEFVKKSQTPNQGEKKNSISGLLQTVHQISTSLPSSGFLDPQTQEESRAPILDCSRTHPPT
jgi:hypothetical protein